MEVCNLLEDSSSVYCALGNSFVEMDVADLLSPYGDEKEMDPIGTFPAVPVTGSFNSIALPCGYSCKEVLTPPQLSLAPCSSSSDDFRQSSASSSTSSFSYYVMCRQESSLSDEEVHISPRLRRSSRSWVVPFNLVKHSISEKRRVIRFNTCIDEFISMLNVVVFLVFYM